MRRMLTASPPSESAKATAAWTISSRESALSRRPSRARADPARRGATAAEGGQNSSRSVMRFSCRMNSRTQYGTVLRTTMIVRRTRGSGMSADLAIEATGVGKAYGQARALAGLDLAVENGTILGVLGPNGAGKTTAVRVLTT